MFYEQALGLPVVEHNDFACVLDANGTMLRITAVSEVSRAGYTILGWRVTDISAAIRDLFAKGVVSCAMTAWIKTRMVSGPLLGARRSPGSPIPTEISCR
jgi:hypothetical protein